MIRETFSVTADAYKMPRLLSSSETQPKETHRHVFTAPQTEQLPIFHQFGTKLDLELLQRNTAPSVPSLKFQKTRKHIIPWLQRWLKMKKEELPRTIRARY